MKYSVVLPKDPKNVKEKVLKITRHNGWGGGPTTVLNLEKKQFSYEFEIDDDREYVYNRTMKDGPTFNVSIEYNDGKGSIRNIQLVPEKVNAS